jgi:hypothetical protein
MKHLARARSSSTSRRLLLFHQQRLFHEVRSGSTQAPVLTSHRQAAQGANVRRRPRAYCLYQDALYRCHVSSLSARVQSVQCTECTEWTGWTLPDVSLFPFLPCRVTCRGQTQERSKEIQVRVCRVGANQHLRVHCPVALSALAG